MFSDELVERAIKYYKYRYDLDISPEIAQGYLHSLADLFESFLNLKKIENSCNID